MQMGSMIFGGGTIYIEGCEFKGISDFSVEDPDIFNDAVQESVTIKPRGEFEFTANIKLNKIILWKLLGLWDWALNNCPNKRVVHLMTHGKNHKVRYKNFLRAIRIIGKELNNG